MSREIKFRVWDKETGAWCCWANANSFFHCDQKGNISWFRNEGRFIIQQYTGLTDKNGKELFEGDIIKQRHNYIDIEERDWIGAVEWHESGWRMMSKEDIGFKLRDCKIIGNVFENPELLK